MSDVSIPEATVVSLDLFPAFSDEAIDHIPNIRADKPVRVIVTDSHVVIYAEVPGMKAGANGPDPALITGLHDFAGGPKTGYVAQTDLGQFHIKRMKHCGCGSTLRAPNPYKGIPYMIQNTPLPNDMNLYAGEER